LIILTKALPIIRSIALDAGNSVMGIYRNLEKYDVRMKKDSSPVTAADLASQTVINDALNREFPEIQIVSEESNEGDSVCSEDFFLVDPLDGTKEFISGNGEFTVNIALISKGRPVLGVVYAPALDLLYWAAEGKGAYKQKSNEKPLKLQCGKPCNPLRLVLSRSHVSDEEKIFIKINRIENVRYVGSSLKGCLIAEGEADLYIRTGDVMEWDIAAMHCIANEAGGEIVFRYHQSPWYGNRDCKITGGFSVKNKNSILKI
jgi:3'(2'), 5'-bisphosphate nucleotidase